MKKVLLFMLGLSLVVGASAQVTLNVSDFPKVWEKYIFGRDTSFSSGIKPGSAGTNQVWDFSTVFSADYTDTVSYSRASDHPNGGMYAGANLVANSNEDGEQFMQMDSVGVWRFIEIPLDTANITVSKVHVAKMPLTYLDVVSDSFSFNQTDAVDTIPFLDSFRVVIKVKTTTTVDGWGQLKLPTKNYSDVLRMQVKSEFITKIEIHNKITKSWTAAPFNPPAQAPEYNYTFFGKGEGDKLLEVSVDTNGNMDDATFRTGQSLGMAAYNKVELNIYPNPANDVLNIISNEQANINIYAADGKLVSNGLSIKGGSNTLNVADYKSGIYFFSGVTQKGSAIEGRFVKQ
jgi:hypothetical protein